MSDDRQKFRASLVERAANEGISCGAIFPGGRVDGRAPARQLTETETAAARALESVLSEIREVDGQLLRQSFKSADGTRLVISNERAGLKRAEAILDRALANIRTGKVPA